MPASKPTPRIMICADHGLAITYFLQTDVIPTILAAGIEVVLLTDGDLMDRIADRFGRPGMIVDELKLDQAKAFEENYQPEWQWWLHFLRRVGGSKRINTEAMDSYIEQVAVEQSNWRRLWMPLAYLAIGILRRSAWARRQLVNLQQRIRPGLYGEMLAEYQPDLVVASTAGWRLDRYLLREASARGIPTATAIVGWDNPSSYSIPGAQMDYVNCWSEAQREELELGADWGPEQIHIGGIPTYDGYIEERWQMDRGDYFKSHGLNPDRKLLSYACSFITFSPNYRNVKALADLVEGDELTEASQLLIRLHPNHFMDVHLFREEREQINRLAADYEHVHLVEPVALGGSLGHYSGEDMEEKASMLAHSDVFLTVYSTMVVEAAVHERPIISVCLDTPGGWNLPRKYSLPLSEIGDWPTHKRFRESGAGQVALTEQQLAAAINRYLADPTADLQALRRFVDQEITYTDGSSGERTGAYFASLVRGEQQ